MALSVCIMTILLNFLSQISFTFEEIFNLLNEFIPEETAFASMTKHPSGGVILIGGMVIYYYFKESIS